MAVKALHVNADARLRAVLEHTHRVFNLCLRQMVERYIDFVKGAMGEWQNSDFLHGMELYETP